MKSYEFCFESYMAAEDFINSLRFCTNASSIIRAPENVLHLHYWTVTVTFTCDMCFGDTERFGDRMSDTELITLRATRKEWQTVINKLYDDVLRMESMGSILSDKQAADMNELDRIVREMKKCLE